MTSIRKKTVAVMVMMMGDEMNVVVMMATM
jgi:hypothetical protein